MLSIEPDRDGLEERGGLRRNQDAWEGTRDNSLEEREGLKRKPGVLGLTGMAWRRERERGGGARLLRRKPGGLCLAGIPCRRGEGGRGWGEGDEGLLRKPGV